MTNYTFLQTGIKNKKGFEIVVSRTTPEMKLSDLRGCQIVHNIFQLFFHISQMCFAFFSVFVLISRIVCWFFMCKPHSALIDIKLGCALLARTVLTGAIGCTLVYRLHWFAPIQCTNYEFAVRAYCLLYYCECNITVLTYFSLKSHNKMAKSNGIHGPLPNYNCVS